MKKVVRIKESELVNLIDKIITETTRKQKISEGVRKLTGKKVIKNKSKKNILESENYDNENNLNILSITEKPHGFGTRYILEVENEDGLEYEYSIVPKENAFREDKNGEINGVYDVIDEFSVLFIQYMPFDLKRFLVGHLVSWISKEYKIPVIK